jgi:glutathione S-transferase
MTRPTLYIGNKTYSSWSLRPWLALRMAGIAFDEQLVPFDFASGNAHFKRFSPSGKVPVLVDGAITVWESLAIIEYAADGNPDAGIWPADAAARARARSVSAEMHSGFGALRHALPMNVRRKVAPLAVGAEVRRDIDRIETIWREARAQVSGAGPFLFGEFCAADAMFAPVAYRFDRYAVSLDPESRAYIDALLELAALKDWEAAARAETWRIEEEEV